MGFGLLRKDNDMIYITGDTHIPIDISKLNVKNFPQQKEMTKDDYVIVCGDFGLIWNYQGSDAEEKYWTKWLDDKSFTTLFVTGNHECFPRINEYPTTMWNGGEIQIISDSIYRLKNGSVFNINGKKFFTMGGARSTDKVYRTEGKSWWPEEIPPNSDFEKGLDNLKVNNNTVDYIISHCCSRQTLYKLSPYFEGDDPLSSFFSVIETDVTFDKWFFGHYHIDKSIDNKHRACYQDIIRLEM